MGANETAIQLVYCYGSQGFQRNTRLSKQEIRATKFMLNYMKVIPQITHVMLHNIMLNIRQGHTPIYLLVRSQDRTKGNHLLIPESWGLYMSGCKQMQMRDHQISHPLNCSVWLSANANQLTSIVRRKKKGIVANLYSFNHKMKVLVQVCEV